MHSVVLGKDDMKIEEAIKQLELNRPPAYTELREAIDMAIAALEKQIPKAEFQGEHRKCICGSFAVGEYCFKCGQKINWSEVEE